MNARDEFGECLEMNVFFAFTNISNDRNDGLLPPYVAPRTCMMMDEGTNKTPLPDSHMRLQKSASSPKKKNEVSKPSIAMNDAR